MVENKLRLLPLSQLYFSELQLSIFNLILQGKSYKEIAGEIGYSEQHIRNNMSSSALHPEIVKIFDLFKVSEESELTKPMLLHILGGDLILTKKQLVIKPSLDQLELSEMVRSLQLFGFSLEDTDNLFVRLNEYSPTFLPTLNVEEQKMRSIPGTNRSVRECLIDVLYKGATCVNKDGKIIIKRPRLQNVEELGPYTSKPLCTATSEERESYTYNLSTKIAFAANALKKDPQVRLENTKIDVANLGIAMRDNFYPDCDAVTKALSVIYYQPNTTRYFHKHWELRKQVNNKY